MQDDLTGGNLGGEVEVDETYIGGKARNMHASARLRRHIGTGGEGKTVVLGILERASGKKPKRIRATVISDRKKATIQPEVAGQVERGSKVYTDDFAHTWRMEDRFEHEMVNHLDKYVSGNCHTNSLENFWSLLKRSVGGTYISVEPFHLFRYVDEQAFRFNNRLMDDATRFVIGMTQIVGRRLTYAQLTGKAEVVQHG
jgi:hypothetical protein